MTYRWDCPYEWLFEKVYGGSWREEDIKLAFLTLARTLDSDTLQALFKVKMDMDGYFDQEEA